MATKKTYINADQELVIQGKLTIEGEVVQQENTVKVNNLQSDELVINSDSQNTTARLTFNSNGTFSNMSYADGGNIIAEPGLQGNLFVANGQSIIIDGGGSIGGTGFTGNLTGTASNANALTSAVTLNLSGDATGSATFTSAGDTATISTTLAASGVSAGQYGSSSAIPVITVDAKGRVTAVSTAATSSILTIGADTGSDDTVTVGLWFPDASSSLENNTRLSVQLASTISGGYWDVSNGVNMLPHHLTVTVPPTCFTISYSTTGR